LLEVVAMTVRLVGLMSLVLLVSLAASAFLLNAHQKGVMEEVRQTASEVGRATLSTLEYRFPETPAALGVALPPSGEVTLQVHAEPSTGHEPAAEAQVRRLQDRVAQIHEHLQGVSVVVVRGAGRPGFAVEARTTCGETAEAGCESTADLLELPELVEGTVTAVEEALREQFFIHLDQIRADSDPAHGTFLRIPTLHAVPARGEGEPGASPARGFVWSSEPHAVPPGAVAATQDIILPIKTDQFDELHARFQRRTLAMFAGVFLLGTVLSASLASRFTRPVRRLDAGIRRLADGDLDVQVEARGRDEVGRLGRAFNEMARRLRAGRDRERELTRREKLSALGRLAAGVAHDVRNPLHSIVLTLEHLQEAARPAEEERAREFDRSLEMIRREIHRLDGLVSNFLRFARSDRGSRVPVDLPELLRDTARLVEKEAERRRVRVEIVSDGDVPAFPADAESIRSSILNLVMNSFEAMQEGGTLTLTVRGGDGEVVLEVADTGCGIPEEDRERVFEFAYTTREDGHGLGLAMVHQVVVEDHGGRISLDSRPGEGTRVRMGFPAGPAGAGA
jgi:signal transduction histidine kinase